MATVLYKDGECENVDFEFLDNYLQAGWSVEPEGEGEAESPAKEEDDGSESAKLSNDEIRELAKEAGIDGWEKKRISTLKSELGHDD